MMNRRLKKASAVLLAMTMLFSLAGCVDQSQGKESSDSGTKTESSADTFFGIRRVVIEDYRSEGKGCGGSSEEEGAGAGWRAEDHCDLPGNRRYL